MRLMRFWMYSSKVQGWGFLLPSKYSRKSKLIKHVREEATPSPGSLLFRPPGGGDTLGTRLVLENSQIVNLMVNNNLTCPAVVSVFCRFLMRFCGFCPFFSRYCGFGYPPMSPSWANIFAPLCVTLLKCSLGYGLLGYYPMPARINVACLLFGLVRLSMASVVKASS